MAAAAFALRRVSPGGGRSFFFSEKPAVFCRNIHITVWWDINECKVPRGCDASSIAGNITAALAKLNYSAPVVFSAYGNAYRIPLNVQHALLDSGVTLIHIPDGQTNNKHVSSVHFTHDIIAWEVKNRQPANCLIISGDERDLPFLYGDMRSSGSNLLFASPRKHGDEMKSVAKALWRWTSLRAGGPPEWTSP